MTSVTLGRGESTKIWHLLTGGRGGPKEPKKCWHHKWTAPYSHFAKRILNRVSSSGMKLINLTMFWSYFWEKEEPSCNVWMIFWHCLQNIWTVSGHYLGNVWTIFWQCFGDRLAFSIPYLDKILTKFCQYLDYIWIIFGQYLDNNRFIFEPYLPNILEIFIQYLDKVCTLFWVFGNILIIYKLY